MRYLLPLLLVACGSTPEDCTKDGCPRSKVCDVASGRCEFPTFPDAGKKDAGVVVEMDAGQMMTSDAGPTTAFVAMKYSINDCAGMCPEQCAVGECSAAVVQMSASAWDTLRAGLTACTIVNTAGSQWTADCRSTSKGSNPASCSDAGVAYRFTHAFVYVPPGANPDACSWTP